MAESREAVRAAGRRLLQRGSRGVRRTVARRKRLLAYLAILGPGMITANAGNDAGGIATFASVGAEHGYRLLWLLIPLTISLGIVQEMCARMGAVTGKGLADLIRERFGVRWTAFVMLALLIANGGRHGFRVCRHRGRYRVVWRDPPDLRSDRRDCHLVARRQGLVQTSRTSLSADVAGLSGLHRFGLSGASGLGRCGRFPDSSEL